MFPSSKANIEHLRDEFVDLKVRIHDHITKNDVVLDYVIEIWKKVKIMSPQLQAIADAIGPLKDAAHAASVLLDGIKAQLDALVAAGSPIDPADVAALAADIGSAKDELAAAVVRDTPAAITP